MKNWWITQVPKTWHHCWIKFQVNGETGFPKEMANCHAWEQRIQDEASAGGVGLEAGPNGTARGSCCRQGCCWTPALWPRQDAELLSLALCPREGLSFQQQTQTHACRAGPSTELCPKRGQIDKRRKKEKEEKSSRQDPSFPSFL